MLFGEAANRLAGAVSMTLGWRPSELWDATPAELAAALQLSVGSDGPEPSTIAALRQRFPDDERQ